MQLSTLWPFSAKAYCTTPLLAVRSATEPKEPRDILSFGICNGWSELSVAENDWVVSQTAGGKTYVLREVLTL